MEFSVKMCYNVLKELAQEKEQRSPKKAAALPFHNGTVFKALVQEIETQRAQGFPPHPKVDFLLNIALEHFLPSYPKNKNVVADSREVEQTQVMIFVTFWDYMEQEVHALNAHHLTICASQFVGQAKVKDGNKGIKQAGQSEVNNSELCFYTI